jgi:endonuclease-3
MMWNLGGDSMKNLDLILNTLNSAYPDALCTLEYSEPWQLLLSTILSAQCTDARVNIVAKELYGRFPTIEAIAGASIEALETILRPCGFYHNKALHLKGCCVSLLTDFHSVVPDSMKALLTLPGVGRKTANLILGEVYGKPTVITDTHCIRLSNRLGFTKSKEPEQVEKDLLRKIPAPLRVSTCHCMVAHGRAICKAQRPLCDSCMLIQLCPSAPKETKTMNKREE